MCRLPRTRRVFFRGSLPCDVLFVGEAPGESENVAVQPFVGPAGRLLDVIIERALGKDSGLAVGFTNLLCCIPREGVRKAAEPLPEEVGACAPRLREMVEIADGSPERETLKLIVAVGAVAQTYLRRGYKHSVELHRRVPLVEIVHPAWILREARQAATGMEISRAAAAIRTALINADALRAAAETAVSYSEDDIPF